MGRRPRHLRRGERDGGDGGRRRRRGGDGGDERARGGAAGAAGRAPRLERDRAAALGAAHIRRLGNASLEIALPDARANYSITVPETVVLTVPADALVSGRQVVAPLPLTILPTPGQGLLSNSLVGNNSEADVQGGGSLLTVTLRDDAWEPSVGQRGSGAADSLTQAVLASFVSAQSEDSGWNAIVRQALQYTDISYVDGASVTLELPPFPAYDLLKAETISVNLPAVAVASGQEVFAGIPRGDALDALQISANTGTCSMSGTLFGNANETTLRSELAYTIVVTLTGDSWTRDVGQFDASGEGASAQLLRGFTSLQSEELGWNAIVRPAAPGEPERGIPQTNVERTSDTTVTITVDQFAAYDITAPETVELVVPQIAVSSAQNVPCKAFLVLPITGSASLSGRLVEAPSEAEVCCADGTTEPLLRIELFGDAWADDVSALGTDGLAVLTSEARGWNGVVQPALISGNTTEIRRVDDTTVEVYAPALAGYEITTPETLVVTLPASTVASKQRVVAAPADGLVIGASPSAVELSGSVHPTAEEATLRRAQGHSLVVTLSADAFVPSIMLPGDASEAFLAGIKSDCAAAAPNCAAGWNAIVRPALAYTAVSWNATAPHVAVVAIPQFVSYDVIAPETIAVVVPAAAVASSRRALKPATFVVLASVGVVRLGGEFLDAANDAALRARPNELAVTLEGDAWLPDIGQPNVATAALLDGLAAVVGESWIPPPPNPPPLPPPSPPPAPPPPSPPPSPPPPSPPPPSPPPPSPPPSPPPPSPPPPSPPPPSPPPDDPSAPPSPPPPPSTARRAAVAAAGAAALAAPVAAAGLAPVAAARAAAAGAASAPAPRPFLETRRWGAAVAPTLSFRDVRYDGSTTLRIALPAVPAAAAARRGHRRPRRRRRLGAHGGGGVARARLGERPLGAPHRRAARAARRGLGPVRGRQPHR